MIVIQPYNPEWTQEFESIRDSLAEILGSRALRIDHIGSISSSYLRELRKQLNGESEPEVFALKG